MIAGGTASSSVPAASSQIERPRLVATNNAVAARACAGERHGEPCGASEMSARRDRHHDRYARQSVEGIRAAPALLMALSWIEGGRGRYRPAPLQQLAANGLGIEPLAVLWRGLGRRITLREQLLKRKAAAPLRLDDQTTAIDAQSDLSAGAQVQKVENNRRNGQKTVA